MKTTPETETSPNHTWTPENVFPPLTRVQWRKDYSRCCTSQINAALEMREAIKKGSK